VTYRSPVSDVLFSLNHVAGFDEAIGAGVFGDLDAPTAASVIEEAGRFATSVIAPLNRVGDLHGARYENGHVATPPGFREAYRAWAAAGWAVTPPRERGELLRAAFELMLEQGERLAYIMSLENGKTLSDSRGEVRYAAEFFRWFSEEAVRNRGWLGTNPAGNNRMVVLHQPIGVSVLVTPWNFPAAMATRKIGPALAAGCTVVLKPASATPLTALALAEIFAEVGVPGGVVNVVPSSRSGS